MILGIAGVARAGKDTLYKLLSEKVPCERRAFADVLKLELYDFVLETYKINIFSCSAEEKETIRPLMVAHNKVQKRIHGDDYFIKKLKEKIKSQESLFVICDVRYDYEAEWIKNQKGRVIYLSKTVNGKAAGPANEEEFNNDYKARQKCDLEIEWPESSDMSSLNHHVSKVLEFLNERAT